MHTDVEIYRRSLPLCNSDYLVKCSTPVCAISPRQVCLDPCFSLSLSPLHLLLAFLSSIHIALCHFLDPPPTRLLCALISVSFAPNLCLTHAFEYRFPFPYSSLCFLKTSFFPFLHALVLFLRSMLMFLSCLDMVWDPNVSCLHDLILLRHVHNPIRTPTHIAGGSTDIGIIL